MMPGQFRQRSGYAMTLQVGRRGTENSSRFDDAVGKDMWLIYFADTDIDIHAKEILRMRHDLNTILANHTGKSIKKIQADTERDNFMSATEACAYGLIDKVLSSREELGGEK